MTENENTDHVSLPRGCADRPGHAGGAPARLARHVRGLLPDAVDARPAWRPMPRIQGRPPAPSARQEPRRPARWRANASKLPQTVPGYAGTDAAGAQPDGLGHGGRRAGPARRSGRSRRQGRARGARGHDDAPGGKRHRGRSGGRAREADRGRSASLRASRGRACFRQHGGMRRRTRRRRRRRLLRWRAVLRRGRLRDRAIAVQHRVRRGHLASQHGDRARRREVRPRRHALLQGHAPGLHHQAVRARQLLQERRAAGRARGVQRLGARAGGRTP